MTIEQKLDYQGLTCLDAVVDGLVVLGGSGLGAATASFLGIPSETGVFIGGSGAVVLKVAVREIRWSLEEDRKKKK